MLRKVQKYAKLIGINLLVLVVLLGILEVVWRKMGYTPGILSSSFQPREGLQVTDLFRGDSLGITKYDPNSDFLSRSSFRPYVNAQGFVSAYDFDSIPTKDDDSTFRIMAVGDSYTSGCCLGDRSYSFVELLDDHPELTVYNFGVLGTDPLQYRLVLDAYLDQVDPDLILVFVYLGNDMMGYAREPRPFQPIGQHIQNYGMTPYEFPYGDSLYRFDNAEDSYAWQYENMTLLGEDVSWWHNLISKSALLTQLYFELAVAGKIRQHDPWIHKPPHAANEISKVVSLAQSRETPIMLMGIPSPKDVINQVDLKEEYQFLFGEYEWNYPDISTFWQGDYDGTDNSNHFNRFGYVKYYLYLQDILSMKYPEVWERD